MMGIRILIVCSAIAIASATAYTNVLGGELKRCECPFQPAPAGKECDRV